ncbi:MAG: molybdopterin-dependent oxidoreductase [bacterium]|jgi:hypothetical protein
MKKNKSGLVSICLAAVLLLVLSGCSQPPAPESAWEVTIIGPDGEKAVAIEDIKAAEAVTLEAEKKEEIHAYTGIKMSSLLAMAGIDEATSVILEAADGYSATINGEVAFSDNTIVAYQIDGADIDSEKNRPLMLVTTEDSSKVWVGSLKVITAE